MYYEDLLEFGWKNLLLFPYHLSDVIIKGLGVTPFHYYINMLDNQMEHCLIDQIIDNGSCPAGYLNYQTVRQLYTKGFIYFDVPIEDDDYVVVPPLELAKILEVDIKLVK